MQRAKEKMQRAREINVQIFKSLMLLSLLCLTMAACGQPTNRPTPQPTEYSLSGAVYAPDGQDIAGTVVVACYPAGDDCDETRTQLVEITSAGPSALFTLESLENLAYELYAVKDVNGDDNYFGDGDYYGEISGAVTPPRSGLDIRMAVLGAGGPVDPGPGEPEPYVVKGRVTDSQGNPLSGVEVFADNTAYYDMNVFGLSDENGYYRIELGDITPSSWQVGAYIEREFEGQRLEFALHVEDDTVFAGVDGAIRNLEWRISGETLGGGYYGGLVYVYTSEVAIENYEFEYFELTFTPDGPLIDGTTGETFAVRLENGSEIRGVPIGRYTVTARYAEPGSEAIPLLIRPRFQETYGTSATLVFEDDELYGLMAELELASP